MGADGDDLRAVQRRVEPVVARAFSEELEVAYSYVDRLCLELCLHVVQDVGLLRAESEPVYSMITKAGVAGDAVYFLETVLEILAEAGFARRSDSGWRSAGSWPPDGASELQGDARRACPAATPLLDIIERCHHHAAAFLTGRTAGLGVIFPRGDPRPWERLHTEDRVMSIYADLVVAALEATVGRGMRMLEVGGGVGAVLQRCAPLLERAQIDDYCFTDVGRLFVQRAERRFGDASWSRFEVADIDSRMVDQGFDAESFDAVIAVNVLHIAKHLHFTLESLREILKPRGYLIIGEGSPPSRHQRWRLDVVFAFLRGWWNVSLDESLRPRPGFLLPSRWERALLACGYDDVCVVPGEDWFAGPCRGGVIVARKRSRPEISGLTTAKVA